MTLVPARASRSCWFSRVSWLTARTRAGTSARSWLHARPRALRRPLFLRAEGMRALAAGPPPAPGVGPAVGIEGPPCGAPPQHLPRLPVREVEGLRLAVLGGEDRHRGSRRGAHKPGGIHVHLREAGALR